MKIERIKRLEARLGNRFDDKICSVRNSGRNSGHPKRNAGHPITLNRNLLN